MWRNPWFWLISSTALLVVVIALWLFVTIRHVQVETVTPDLWMLRGLGGNVAVLRTDEGAVVVDSMTTTMQGSRIVALAQSLTGQPVSLLINTHWHLDHTHGNPAFPAGIRVVATENTRRHLLEKDADTFAGAAAATLPAETFTDQMRIRIGGKTIDLLHPGRGHTDGDLVVIFNDERAIHMGDLLFNAHYPNIDLESGGTVAGWSATLDRVLREDFQHVIPGHGDRTDRDGILRFRTFIDQLAAIGRAAVENDWTLDQTLANAALTADAGFEEIRMVVPIGLDRDFVITRAWEEATGNVGAR